MKDNSVHNICNVPVSAFMYDYNTQRKYYYNFSHSDIPIDITFEDFKSKLEQSNSNVYVIDKKKYKYFLNCNLIDVNLFEFLKNSKTLVEPEYFIPPHFTSITKNLNLIIPYVLHQNIFDQEVEIIKKYENESIDSYCFNFFNNIVSDTLFNVEKNGIKIDESVYDKFFEAKKLNGHVYTDYHIYNPTGRPSNCFDGINYAALKKDDGSRASFVSRYNNGYLLMVDFTGFHPYIVANLIGYKVPDDETIYEHLAKHYYNETTSHHVAKSKKLTMINLYGQISDQYLNIEFFKKTEQLKDKYWNRFLEKGYVTTPIYKRKITNNHIIDPNKNKLFAYIIQATETEYGIDRLKACLTYTKGKEILPILYNYDAILFDVGNADEEDIKDLIELIKNKKFKVKVYKGNNYHNLTLI